MSLRVDSKVGSVGSRILTQNVLYGLVAGWYSVAKPDIGQ
jgi:hypothetical protein